MADETKKEAVDQESTEKKATKRVAKTEAVGDGFPDLVLLEMHNHESLTVLVGNERVVGRNGFPRVKPSHAVYGRNDLLYNALALVGKHPILFLYFEPISAEDKERILATPTYKLAQIQRARTAKLKS